MKKYSLMLNVWRNLKSIFIAIFEDGAPDRTGDVGEAFPSGTCTLHFGEVKNGVKMFNFEILFLHGFSSKNREKW